MPRVIDRAELYPGMTVGELIELIRKSRSTMFIELNRHKYKYELSRKHEIQENHKKVKQVKGKRKKGKGFNFSVHRLFDFMFFIFT